MLCSVEELSIKDPWHVKVWGLIGFRVNHEVEGLGWVSLSVVVVMPVLEPVPGSLVPVAEGAAATQTAPGAHLAMDPVDGNALSVVDDAQVADEVGVDLAVEGVDSVAADATRAVIAVAALRKALPILAASHVVADVMPQPPSGLR